MKMRKRNKILRYCISLLLSLSIIVTNAQASSLERTLANTGVSGWAYSTQSGHMGKKASTYTFDSSYTYNVYSNYFTNGTALWGTTISAAYTPQTTSATGIVAESDASSDAVATTSVISVNNSGHRTKYQITIYSMNFFASWSSVPGRNRVIAHEIGHAYGLGHVNQANDIMYDTYSDSTQVTSQALWGMKVVTHQHNHSSSTSGSFSQYNELYHKVLCSSCKAIYLQDHSYVNGTCTKCGRIQ